MKFDLATCVFPLNLTTIGEVAKFLSTMAVSNFTYYTGVNYKLNKGAYIDNYINMLDVY